MRTTTLFGIAAAAALALAGCSSSSPTPATSLAPSTLASPSPSASATPAPSASPSPSVVAVACEDEGIVPGRLGCLDTNDMVTAVPAGLLSFAPDFCSPGVGRWRFVASPDLVGIDGDDTTIVGRIDVYDPSFTTPEGIHVGSSEADVLAAYPATPPTTSFSGTKLVVQSNAEGSYVIELADEWGSAPWTVANIRIYAAGIDANYPVYGTEDLAGVCPFDF